MITWLSLKPWKQGSVVVRSDRIVLVFQSNVPCSFMYSPSTIQ